MVRGIDRDVTGDNYANNLIRTICGNLRTRARLRFAKIHGSKSQIVYMHGTVVV